MKFAGALVLVCILTSTAFAQVAPDTPAFYPIEYSSLPMTRHASLVETGVRVIERGSDWATDRWTGDLFSRRSVGGRLARLGWWTGFSFLVAGCGSAAVHEYGHATRAKEIGLSAEVHINCLGGAFFTARGPALTATGTMSLFGGGLEAERVLSERIERRIYKFGTATIGDLTMLFIALAGAEGYILRTLSEDRLSSRERFLLGGTGQRIGDPAQYVRALAAARRGDAPFEPLQATEFFEEIQSTGRSVRRGSLINLLDYEHVTIGVGIFRDYLWRGERKMPIRWIKLGSLSVAPGMSYQLSPVGPERQVKARYTTNGLVGRAYVRWTDSVTPGSDRLLGTGGEIGRIGLRRIDPRAGFDLWRNPDGTTSIRAEAAATLMRSLSDRVAFSAAVGAKGKGYLTGHPIESGAYFTIGAGFRF